MAENLTYDQLVNSLISYDARVDQAYLDAVPNFIMLGENRLATEMKQQGFQAVVTGNFALGNVQAKPSFWRETIAFGYLVNGVYTQMFLRNLEFCRAYAPDNTVTAPPKYYADYNINNFFVANGCDSTYPFELVYYARLDPLTPAHQENWLTLNAPQALLYAALYESAMWRKNIQAMATFKGEYGQAVSGLMAENKERLADRGTVVDRG